MEELDNLKELVLYYARGVWKSRWIGASIAWVILVGGILFVDQIQNKYTAETKVYLDSTSVLKPLLRGLAIDPDLQATVRLMAKQLFSRPNLERAIRLMEMDLEVDDPVDLENIISGIQKRIKISAGRRGTDIYTITYTDTNRFKARKMVQIFLDIFVEDALGRSGIESDSALDFLNSQIVKYEGLLQEAEKRRAEFKRKNIGLMPRDGNNYYAQLQSADIEIENSELLLTELEHRRDEVRNQIETFKLESSNPVVTTETSLLNARIEEQENTLDELLLLYTERHPDVIIAQKILATLRQRKSSEQTQLSWTSSVSENPVYQELQISLARTEADISSIGARLIATKKKRVDLKKLVDIVPRIEAELQRLNRDYEIHRQKYTEFVSRREKILISEDVEAGIDRVTFRMIEPPFVPRDPSYPKRPLFDLAVVVLAIGIGYGIALLISMLQPVFYNQRDLMKIIGGSVLGTVRNFDSPSMRNKRRGGLAAFGIVNFFFIATAGSLTYLHSKGALITDQFPQAVLIFDQLKALVTWQ